MVDHLQFGDTSDPEVYWSFVEAVGGMADYCRGIGLPVVGGKVSFYNQDEATGAPIKPAPVAMVVGIAPTADSRVCSSFGGPGEWVFIVGSTKAELGGSEYYETILGRTGGAVPSPDPSSDALTYRAVLRLVRRGHVGSLHDCSKGGLAVGLAEMSIRSKIGAVVDLSRLVGCPMSPTEELFSETHGRFLLSTSRRKQVAGVLSSAGIPHYVVGKSGGASLTVTIGSKKLISLPLSRMEKAWESTLPRLLS
jgi:phosphoribosylformylglycinamidine synthase